MNRIIKFIVITFAASWSTIYCIPNGLGMMMCMLMPTIGAYFAGVNFRDLGWNPECKDNKNLILLAWLLPSVLEIAGAVLYFLVFPSDFDMSGTFLHEHNPKVYTELIESGSSYVGYILKEFLFSLISPQLCYGIFLALGEEIGWRGFLFPELDLHFGRTKAALIGGIIHGVWHFPLILTGYEYGRDYLGAPVMGPFVFCFFTVSTGIISYYLYRKSSSIWLPALFHAAVNATVDLRLLRGLENRERMILGPGSVGLISVIPTVIIAARILYVEYKQENVEYNTF